MAFESAESLVEEDVGDSNPCPLAGLTALAHHPAEPRPKAGGNGLPRREALTHITRNARFCHATMRRRTPKA